jgi:hypothetical protein
MREPSVGAVAAFFVTWAGCRFSIGRLGDFAPASYLGTPVIPPADARSGLIRWLCRLLFGGDGSDDGKRGRHRCAVVPQGLQVTANLTPTLPASTCSPPSET